MFNILSRQGWCFKSKRLWDSIKISKSVTQVTDDADNGNTPPLLVGLQTCTTAMKISMEVPQKTGNWSASKPSYATFGHIPEKHFILPQRHLLKYVHRSFIHNRQTLETSEIPLNQRGKHGTFTQWSVAQMLKDDIMNVAGKWMEIEKKNHPEWGNSDPERQTWYLRAYKGILAIG